MNKEQQQFELIVSHCTELY